MMPILTPLPVSPSLEWTVSTPVMPRAWAILGDETPSAFSSSVRASSAVSTLGRGMLTIGWMETTWSSSARESTSESSTDRATPFHRVLYSVVTRASMPASLIASTRSVCSASIVAREPPWATAGEDS